MSDPLLQLKEKVDQLEEAEHEQLFKIIRKYTRDYTRSENGAYVSSKNLSQECIQEMFHHVNFCFDQRTHLAKDNELRAKYEKLIKTDNSS